VPNGRGPIVTIDTPAQDGASLAFTGGDPSATANGTAGTQATPVVSMLYQIDGGLTNTMPVPTTWDAQNRGIWSLTLTTSDCPDADTDYLLTIYAWDANGMGINARSFHRTT
jgi:hypothetical protein